MKDLMRLIEQESYQVSDPVTDFLQCLYTNYDFDGAQQKLQECEQVGWTLSSAEVFCYVHRVSFALVSPDDGCHCCSDVVSPYVSGHNSKEGV